MGNLKQQGYRFMVNMGARDAFWCHPAEVSSKCAAAEGWTDCTDMSDDEFGAFMDKARAEVML